MVPSRPLTSATALPPCDVEGQRVGRTAVHKLGAVLVQSGQGSGHPTAIPAMGRRLRHVSRVKDPFCRQTGVVVTYVVLVVVVATDPNSVVREEGRCVGIEEGVRQRVVGLVVRIGAVVRGRVRTQLVVRRHICGEIPRSSQLEQIRMLQDEILCSEARLGEPDQPVLFGSGS